MTDAQEEQVLFVAHKHVASFLSEALFVACPGFLIMVLLLFSRSQVTEADTAVHALLTLLLPLCFLIIWIVLCGVWTMFYLDALIITDRRIFYVVQTGLAGRSVSEWNIENARVGVRVSGVLQSFFKYGTLIIEAPGAEPAKIPDIPDPESVSAVILKQDNRFGELQETARKQQDLLKFISHEVKGHLTKSKAAFAAIVEGDFGPVGTEVNELAHEGLKDSQKGVETVMSILDNADIAHGDLTLVQKEFDLSETIRRAVREFQPQAGHKGLALASSIDGSCVIKGDEQKIERHVIRNFLDNAIRYTPAGQIDVVLEKANGMARFSVSDTGVGMSEGDMARLFTEGGHGEHSKQVNPESTGYGLYVAKQIVDKHGGKVSAYSNGPGTGSQFFAEFPLG